MPILPPPGARAREKVLVDSLLVITILILIVTTSKALVTSSDALVPWSHRLLSILDPSGMFIFLLELAAGAIARSVSGRSQRSVTRSVTCWTPKCVQHAYSTGNGECKGITRVLLC